MVQPQPANEHIAWNYLSDIEIMQLLHCRPDLREDYDKKMGYKVSDTHRDSAFEAMSQTMDLAVGEDKENIGASK